MHYTNTIKNRKHEYCAESEEEEVGLIVIEGSRRQAVHVTTHAAYAGSSRPSFLYSSAVDGPLERGRDARFDVCAVEAEAEVRETAMLE